MLYLKWIAYVIPTVVLKVVSLVFAPIIVLFGEKGVRNGEEGSYLPWWLDWFQTWDNPLEGDTAWQTRIGPYPNVTTGWKGWWNKVRWLWRNSTYGWAKNVVGLPAAIRGLISSHDFKDMASLDIGDRNGKAGSYLIYYSSSRKVEGFEFYYIRQYKRWPNKCIRIRLGWKINSSKFDKNNPAQLVMTVAPWKEFKVK